MSRKTRTQIKPQAGFTIVELIIAMVVGSIFAATMTVLVINQARLSESSRDLTLSNSYAETKIEALRSAGYNNLSNGTTDITSELPNELNEPRSGSQVISDFTTGIKQVDISITYSDQGTAKTSEYRTFVGELGVGQY